MNKQYIRKRYDILSDASGTTTFYDDDKGLYELVHYTNVAVYSGSMALTSAEVGVEYNGLEMFVSKTLTIAQAAIYQYTDTEIIVGQLEKLYIKLVHAAASNPVSIVLEGYVLLDENKAL